MIVRWRSLASKLRTSVTISRLTVVFCYLLQGSWSTIFPPVLGTYTTEMFLLGTYRYRHFVIFHVFQCGNSPVLYKIWCWNSQHMMQRQPQLSPVKICEEEFRNTLTLVITHDIEPTLLVAIRQRLWWYKCPYKHKIMFDIGSCWKGFKQYAQCGLGFLPGDIAWVNDWYLCKNICCRRTANVALQMFWRPESYLELVLSIDSLSIKKGTCFITLSSFSSLLLRSLAPANTAFSVLDCLESVPENFKTIEYTRVIVGLLCQRKPNVILRADFNCPEPLTSYWSMGERVVLIVCGNN